jgi:cation transport regulator ChaC
MSSYIESHPYYQALGGVKTAHDKTAEEITQAIIDASVHEDDLKDVQELLQVAFTAAGLLCATGSHLERLFTTLHHLANERIKAQDVRLEELENRVDELKEQLDNLTRLAHVHAPEVAPII